MLKLNIKIYKYAKTIKQPYKKVTNLDKDQTNRYSDKFVNTSKCFDSTQYLQAKAKETLNKDKTINYSSKFI